MLHYQYSGKTKMSESPHVRKPENHSLPKRALAGLLATTMAVGGAGAWHNKSHISQEAVPTETPLTEVVPAVPSPTIPGHIVHHKPQDGRHKQKVHNNQVLSPRQDTLSQPEPAKPMAKDKSSNKPETESKPKPKPVKHVTIDKPGQQEPIIDTPEEGLNTPDEELVIPVEELPTPETLLNLHPELLRVPPELSAYMHDNVTYFPATGCSGLLIKNQAGEAVGSLTAQHCGMLKKDGRWGTDEDGQSILNFDLPVTFSTGDSADNLSQVERADQFILNGPEDLTKDQALAVFRGHTPEEVMANFPQMTPDEIAQLKTGDTIYNSGWPVDQPNNHGPMHRQEFPMTVLGTASWEITNGERLNLLVTAVPANKDGTECSWGNSGSAGLFQTETGEIKVVGTASAFNDFGLLYNKDPGSAMAERKYIENLFGVDMTGYVGVCGFAYEKADVNAGAVVAKVKPAYDPERDPIVLAENRCRDAFFDPAKVRQIVEGKMILRSPKGDLIIDRGILCYDELTNVPFVGWYQDSAKAERHLVLQPYTGDYGLDNLELYPRDGESPPNIGEYTGAIQQSDQPASYFMDENYFAFGGLSYSDGTATLPGKPYKLVAENGGFRIVEAEPVETPPVEATPTPVNG
jgi:hypothetical protein